jgi:hypothetical protein
MPAPALGLPVRGLAAFDLRTMAFFAGTDPSKPHGRAVLEDGPRTVELTRFAGEFTTEKSAYALRIG